MTDPADNNLLVPLHGLAKSQDENFVTETFAHLLRHLLEHEPVVGVGLLGFLTDGKLNVPKDEAKSVSVSTQVATAEGTPDIRICTSHHLVIVEVKLQSSLGPRQLEKYRRILNASHLASKTLVLLSRYSIEPDEKPDVTARWYRIADWLRERAAQRAWCSPVSDYLVRQFIGFMQARGITMEQVNWQMLEGVKAMQNLIAMMEEVLNVKGRKLTTSFGRSWSGFYIENKKAWVGLWHDNPEYVAFQVDLPQGERLAEGAPDFGEIGDGKNAPFRWNWSYRLDLTSEDVHFFALSQASQMQRMEKFVEKGFSALATLTAGKGQEGSPASTQQS